MENRLLSLKLSSQIYGKLQKDLYFICSNFWSGRSRRCINLKDALPCCQCLIPDFLKMKALILTEYVGTEEQMTPEHSGGFAGGGGLVGLTPP